MARFHGAVGFRIVTDNQETGMVENTVVERTYYGKVLEHTRRWQSSDVVTDDLVLANQIAITANDYAFEHSTAIAYVYYMNGRWKVTSMRVKGPELILSLGGVYNGPIPDETAGGAENSGSEGLVQETPGKQDDVPVYPVPDEQPDGSQGG